jgi:hypothetical protein
MMAKYDKSRVMTPEAISLVVLPHLQNLMPLDLWLTLGRPLLSSLNLNHCVSQKRQRKKIWVRPTCLILGTTEAMEKNLSLRSAQALKL